MRTVEERLECLKETVANQKIKINDLDKKVDELESSLRKEQAINKLYEKVMNGANVSKKTMNELCDWIDSNINDGYLTEDDAKVEKYEKMKNDLNEYVGYLWR